MNWLVDLFVEPSFLQAIFILAMVCALGLWLGKFKLFGVSLGITFVFFAGILGGHLANTLGITIDPSMLILAQNFGLILFVYELGVQVGPGFFTSLKQGGVRLNMMALGVIVVGTLMAVVMSTLGPMGLPEMMGVLSGAVTNTPMLGGAQAALLEVHPDQTNLANNMATACAVAYPFGIIGTILGLVVMRSKFKKTRNRSEEGHGVSNTFISEYKVVNPAIFGKNIKEIAQTNQTHMVITRVWRDGKVNIPTSDTVLQEGDHLLVISSKNDVDILSTLFGEMEKKDWNKEGIDWNSIDNSKLVSRHVLVTKSNLNGVKLGTLKLRNNYGINITKINRAGISLLASPNIRLQLGDRLTVVGHEKAINNVSEILGNEEKVLQNPNLVAMFIGLAVGVLLGAIPLAIPGMSTPIKLGVAGGPIVVGILMGAFGPRFHLSTYTTRSANLMLRQFGIVVYLACLGFAAGGDFVQTVFRPEGLLWIGLSLVLSFVPVVAMGYVSAKFFKMSYAHVVGMLSGSMANPIALNYANSTVDDEEPSEAYATVYPLSMFVRVISAQMIMILLS
jgi:AspT/YidE/YbjL antiporter-like protein